MGEMNSSSTWKENIRKIYTDSINKNSVTDWSIPKIKRMRLLVIDNKTNSGGLTDFNDAIIELDTIVNIIFEK